MNSVGGSDESDGKVEGKREKRREEKERKRLFKWEGQVFFWCLASVSSV